MLIKVDAASPVPLFEQLAASVRSEVSRGVLLPGDRLPSAREVAASLSINLHTVLRAYQQLRDEGLVDLRRGRGAVVTDKARQYEPNSLALPTLIAEAKRLGLSSSALVALVREEYNT
jgi:GntR family transcriptional regulator